MTEARLLTEDDDTYRLTPLGRNLVEVLRPLDAWSRRWAEETAAETDAATNPGGGARRPMVG
ncbi:hypothetical protein ACFY8C_27565 [Streptomyces flavochromogenes]|uniref:HTH hxlR-type domain-containing protein n=1 Tax=Streptomyces flavochromogenes TaxID=68199 RepID=A0ABW6XX27_9ACTN|nr:hypothetical protein [Streptomyces flavochromogenes]